MPNVSMLARTCATAALGLAVGMAGYGSAQAETYQMRVKAGERIRLDAYASHDGPQSGCASQPGLVRLLVLPRGGVTTQGRERAVLNNNLKPGNGNDCMSVPKNAASLYYQARPDFSGVDRVVTGVRFSGGDYHEFTYLVTVDPGVVRPAPAQAPAAAARPRQDTRPSPVERPADTAAAAPTSASDFLSRVTREGRRTSPPAAAPGAPPPVAAQEPAVPSAERITSAQPETPRAAAAPQAAPQTAPPAEMGSPPPRQRVFEPRL